jgi:hypothetical protein
MLWWDRRAPPPRSLQQQWPGWQAAGNLHETAFKHVKNHRQEWQQKTVLLTLIHTYIYICIICWCCLQMSPLIFLFFFTIYVYIYITYRYIILNNIWVIWIHVYLWCSQNVSKFNKQHDNSSIFDPCTMNCTALTKRNKAQRLAATLSASHQLALNTVNIEM